MIEVPKPFAFSVILTYPTPPKKIQKGTQIHNENKTLGKVDLLEQYNEKVLHTSPELLSAPFPGRYLILI